MKMSSLFKVAAVGLCVTLFLLALFPAATEAKRSRKRNKGKKTKKIYISASPCSSGCSTSENCFGSSEFLASGSSSDQYELEDVANSLTQTVQSLGKLNRSLSTLLDGMRFNETMFHVDKCIKELNPTTSLTSDKQFKLLGQVTWNVNWIRASLEIVRIVGKKNTVPRVDDVSLASTLQEVKDLQGNLYLLNDQLGFNSANVKGKGKGRPKGKDPLQCLTVKVARICKGRSKDCEKKERARAFLIFRDARRGVQKMLETLETCQVQEQGNSGEFSLGEGQMDRTVFTKFWGKVACDLQKSKCKSCLTWNYN